jgi:hypothetical protein
MKYYIGEIDTYFGESSVTTTVKFKTDIAPSEYLDALASEFWGEADEPDDSELYDFGDKSSGGGRWQEVDAITYDALHIIVELNKGEEV